MNESALARLRWHITHPLPLLEHLVLRTEIQKSQGPYYVSISFALLAYFEAFVLLGGAFVAAHPADAAEKQGDDVSS